MSVPSRRRTVSRKGDATKRYIKNETIHGYRSRMEGFQKDSLLFHLERKAKGKRKTGEGGEIIGVSERVDQINSKSRLPILNIGVSSFGIFANCSFFFSREERGKDS